MRREGRLHQLSPAPRLIAPLLHPVIPELLCTTPTHRTFSPGSSASEGSSERRRACGAGSKERKVEAGYAARAAAATALA